MLIFQVQCPKYKFVYPESEPVLLAGDMSERQSLTTTITHYVKFYILLVLTKREITKYINWRQFTKGTRGKQNEQLFPK